MKTVFIFSCVVALILAQERYVQDEMLRKHNIDRRRHQVGDLVGSSGLRGYAQDCCNVNAKRNEVLYDCKRLSRRDANAGANFALVTDSQGSPSVQAATQMAYKQWYDEQEPNYDYDAGRAKAPGLAVLQFTQVVWKRTTLIGCAYARNETKKSTAVCCLYLPRGNTVGDARDNVFRPTSTRPA